MAGIPTLSDKEREVANETAKFAMVQGWDNAILRTARQYGVPSMDIRVILDKAAKYNDVADPSGRIDELDDWMKEKRGRSRQAAGGKLHLLSPGLRAYMEAKQNASKTP